ncbi:MAG TPA: ATP-binding protein [Bryobacteraceae bacterium]|nr:ATP-binding protein [Bryobacteraceae bacterium]
MERVASAGNDVAAQALLAERTAQLDAVSSELDSLYYSVSHDLRAAIRGITACAQIVLEDHAASLNDEIRRWLTHIHDDGERLDRFTQSLLELSRVSRAAMHPVELDLTALVGEIAHELRSASPKRPVQFDIQKGMTAFGDPHLVRQVLGNLLENAWKFTIKTANPRIEVGCKATSAVPPIYWVRDNGMGFDMAGAGRLFVAFQQLHQEKDIPGSGTGTGLAIVRRIVHRHGGRVWAESRPGDGATFFFSLGAAPGQDHAG